MYKYIKIAEDLKGNFSNIEEKLPSIRELAQQFNCSKQTIVQALKVLEAQHLIYSKPQSGYYIVSQKDGPMHESEKVFDFATASPDWTLFPYEDFKHCVNQAMTQYHKELFVYGTSKGLPQLIQTIKSQLENNQVFTHVDNLFITSGIQQALSIFCQMPFPNQKETILLEEPTYSLFIDLIKLYNLPTTSIKRTKSGVDLTQLEEIFKKEEIKFFYTIPRYHNPLGSSYTKELRQQIVKLAHKYNVYILEDDYLADFDRNKKRDPLFSYDINEKVIYLKSYSKILFPGLRIGAVVVPDQLRDPFSMFKKASDIDSAMFSQAALELYINNGMYDHHLKKIREIYYQKTELFKKTVKNHKISGKLNLSPPLAMKTHLTMPDHLAMKSLVKRLNEKKVWIDSSDSNYHLLQNRDRDNHLFIELSNTRTDCIEEGTNLLLNEIENMLRL